jgi:hypothetical protein
MEEIWGKQKCRETLKANKACAEGETLRSGESREKGSMAERWMLSLGANAPESTIELGS